jgi:hypothetical protein
MHVNLLQHAWEWVSDKSVIGLNTQQVNSFEITPEMKFPVIGDVIFKVSANNSKVQTYTVTLIF